ncbi:MAG: DUF1592 domain-containing protein [Myxococcota bacterium]
MAFALLASGCYTGLAWDDNSAADPGNSGEDNGASADGDEPDEDTAGPAATCADMGVDVAFAPLARITRLQYQNSIRDILGVELSLEDELIVDDKAGSFNSNTLDAASATHVNRYRSAAEFVAAQVIEQHPEQLACDPPPDQGPDQGPEEGSEEECVTDHARRLARRFYGRTPSAAQVENLVALFATVRANESYEVAMQTMLEGLLQSPHFLYHVEEGNSDDEVAPLTGPELARRLATFLWSSAPDEILLDAAEAGELATAEQVAAQATRMLGDPRADELLAHFHRQWLRLDGSAFMVALPDESERASVANETLAFIDRALGSGDDDITSMLNSRAAVLDDHTAELYGMPGASGDTMLPPGERSGLLTRAGFLAANGSVTARGLFVRSQMMCQQIPPPPEGVSTELPDLGPDATERELLEAHQADPTCAGCHNLFDPIGLGFLNYGHDGAFHEQDEHGPIDNSGQLDEASFNGALELSQMLGQMEDVHECLTEQWFNFGLARESRSSDQCSIEQAAAEFVSSGPEIETLIVALTKTDAFRYRRATPQQ